MKAASIGFEMQKDLYTGSKKGRPSILAQQGHADFEHVQENHKLQLSTHLTGQSIHCH